MMIAERIHFVGARSAVVVVVVFGFEGAASVAAAD